MFYPPRVRHVDTKGPTGDACLMFFSVQDVQVIWPIPVDFSHSLPEEQPCVVSFLIESLGSMGEYTVDFQSGSFNMHTACRRFSGLSCFNLSPVLMERRKSSLFQRGETGRGQMRNRSGFLRLHLNPQTSAVQAVWIYRVLCCHGSGGQR